MCYFYDFTEMGCDMDFRFFDQCSELEYKVQKYMHDTLGHLYGTYYDWDDFDFVIYDKLQPMPDEDVEILVKYGAFSIDKVCTLEILETLAWKLNSHYKISLDYKDLDFDKCKLIIDTYKTLRDAGKLDNFYFAP